MIVVVLFIENEARMLDTYIHFHDIQKQTYLFVNYDYGAHERQVEDETSDCRCKKVSKRTHDHGVLHPVALSP